MNNPDILAQIEALMDVVRDRERERCATILRRHGYGYLATVIRSENHQVKIEGPAQAYPFIEEVLKRG